MLRQGFAYYALLICAPCLLQKPCINIRYELLYELVQMLVLTYLLPIRSLQPTL